MTIIKTFFIRHSSKSWNPSVILNEVKDLEILRCAQNDRQVDSGSRCAWPE